MHSLDLPTRTPPAVRARRPLRAGAASLVLLVGLAGCGYASTQAGAASSTSSVPAPSPSGTAPSASGSAAPTTPGSTGAPGTGGTPGAPNPGGPISPPVAQADSAPAGSKLVVFEGVSRSSDGQTLYLAATAGGGACGQYDVVVQESAGTVEIGLAHLPMAKAVPCPMFVRLVQFPAHLSAPIGNREVVDLANGQDLGTGGSLAVISTDVPKLPGAQYGEPSQTARAFNPVTS